MNQNNLLKDLIAQAAKEVPNLNLGFLESSVLAAPLTAQEMQSYQQLLDFARSLQNENPAFESAYQHLLHLYVLNGSRLDLLKTIDRRLRGLVEGQGSILLISGVSGIGKTSLVMAFHRRIHQLGAEFIPVHCFEQQSTSYALWQDIAHSISAKMGISLEALLAPLGQGAEARSFQELKLSLSAWLKNSAAVKPLVILLDDLHWADADSLELFNQLTSQDFEIPILFIANYRSEETQSHHPLDDFLPQIRRNRKVDLIQLDPMTSDDVERLVNGFHGSCSPQLARYLHDRAEGHPLFTVELLNDLVSQNLLPRDPVGSLLSPEKTVPLPKYLTQLILQRISRLGSQVEQVLAVGAVAGETWSLNIIEPLVDMPEEELLEAVESALRAEIITDEGDKAETYRFSHGLIREVLYAQPLARRRKRLHERIAGQYEQQQIKNLFVTAQHYFEAEKWGKAASACLAAGEEANRQFAFHSALRWYQQALNAAELAEKDVLPAVHLSIYEQLGRSFRALDQREAAVTVYSQMVAYARSVGDLVAEVTALINLAMMQTTLYLLDLAEKTASEALKIGEQAGDLRLITDIHACLGGLFVIRGQLDQAKIHLNYVLTHREVLGDSRTLLDTLRLCAYQAIWSGKYQEAENYARQALQLALPGADPVVIAGASQNLATAQIESGQFLAAHQNLSSTLDAVEIAGAHHHQKPRLLNLMGYLYLELGDAQEALAWDQKALAAIQEPYTLNVEMRRYSLLNMATDYLHLGRMDQVLETVALFETIKDGAEFARFRYFNRYQLLMCEVQLVQETYEEAIELAHEARALAQSKGVLKNIARSHWLEGQALTGMMRYDKALEHLNIAAAIVDNIQHGSLRWKIRLSQADVLRKAGQPADGALRQARALIDQTIHSLSGSLLQQVFLASQWIKQLEKLEQSSTQEKPAYPAGLTRREVEILRLVARGATNQQVADILHISVRTVNTHMTNILNKTGLDNRTAAGVFAIQHKLVSTS